MCLLAQGRGRAKMRRGPPPEMKSILLSHTPLCLCLAGHTILHHLPLGPEREAFGGLGDRLLDAATFTPSRGLFKLLRGLARLGRTSVFTGI